MTQILQRTGDRDVFHGEGAFWDDRIGALRHVDMLAGDVITIRDGGAVERDHVGDVVAVVRHRRAGGYVVALERGFALLDDELRIEQEIPVFDDPGLRMNEGACDAHGRFYVGSMAYDSSPGAGALYRLDPDLTVHVALEGQTVPNGLVWTGDGRALHADTAGRRVWAYDFDPATGVFGARTSLLDLARMDGIAGMPDGMALDAEGGLWVALYGGGAVRRFDVATGRLTDTIDVGVSNPTSCAFGGADGRTLFITTSREGLDEGAEPDAGLVVAVDVGVTGAPVHAFAG